MKGNRRYKEKDSLEIMDMKINSRVCCRLKVEFLIDARHILLAITCLTDEDLKKPSRKKIEEELKHRLHEGGEGWYISPIDYGEDGEHYNLSEKLREALPIAKKFFPEFMELPQSIKFIRDLA
jgi:hypothetical protein